MNRKLQSRGFTLIEIIISMGLITVALLAVFRLQAQNLDLQSETQFITLSNYLAQDRIAQIQAEVGLDAGTRSGDFGDDAPHFSYREEITEVTDMEDIFKVRVVIALASGEFVKEFSVETYLHREAL
ncbi:MAG: prepilin-type N-terminal cleavage/methylation domain-containing protein [Deltaproteobacteria bacterium]|nr:prepilin-type N-terminal cleavage/methylation domain-containing protein [Deltaproteobacteria bacterium]